MRTPCPLLLFAVCSLALCCELKAVGAGLKSDDRCAASFLQPAGLSLRLSLKNEQAVFRQGEIITLVTSYTSQDQHKYIWLDAANDRSELVDLDHFCVEPDSGRDPLRDYLDSQISFGIDILYNDWPLGQKPQTSETDLNEAFSLPPGNYRLHALGYRVSNKRKYKHLLFDRKPIPLRSNDVEFTIIEADPEWQVAQISAALDALNTHKTKCATAGSVIFCDDDEDRARAKRVLRFLGARESEHQIAIAFANEPNGEQNWQYIAGLWASTNRLAVIDDMRAILQSHQNGINEYFVWALAGLEMHSDPKWKDLLDHRYEGFIGPGDKTDQYLTELNRRVDVYLAEAGTKRKVTPEPAKE